MQSPVARGKSEARSETNARVEFDIKSDLTSTAIKVEESKVNLYIEGSSPSSSPAQVESCLIKSEDEEKVSLPDPEDPKHHCRACQKTYNSRDSYRHHLYKVHNVRRAPIPNQSISPDPSDPNNYCRSCRKTFSSRSTYRQHLFAVHNVELRTKLDKKTTPNLAIIPDPNDPNQHCRTCLKTFSRKDTCNQHLVRVHNTETRFRIRTTPNHAIIPDPSDPKRRCRSCQKTFTTKYHFYQHLLNKHNIEMRRRTTIPNHASTRSIIPSIPTKPIKPAAPATVVAPNSTIINPNFQPNPPIDPALIDNRTKEERKINLARVKSHAMFAVPTAPTTSTAFTRPTTPKLARLIAPKPSTENPNFQLDPNNSSSSANRTKRQWATNLTRVESDAGDRKNKTCKFCQEEYHSRNYYLYHMHLNHKNGTR